MERMRALVREGHRLAVRQVPRPRVAADGDVVVRVIAAGVCRTDLYVAEGRLPAANPIILGHEFAGFVSEAGFAAGFAPGQPVTALPALPCGRCRECTTGGPDRCAERVLLGVHRHGAFADFVCVPAHAVHALPADLPFVAGAYAEPVAAALAVLRAGVTSAQHGVICGDNRIARLLQKVLAARGFFQVPIRDASALEPGAYDYVIEAGLSGDALPPMLRALRPGGKLVLKSRRHEPVALPVAEAVYREVIIQAVNYGSFPEAIALLGQLDLAELIGAERPLEDFEAVFADARRDESRKPFFRLAGELG